MATARRLARLRSLDALALTSGIWFLAKFVRYAFPPLFETLGETYDVSNATLGLLFTLLMLVYAGMQFPSGALADRFGTVRVIVAGVLILSAAGLLLFATQAFGALVAAVVLIGLGTGAHKTVAINLLAAIYPARTGRTLGTMDAIGELAGVAAPAAVVAVLSMAIGWPGLFLAIGIAGAILAAAFGVQVPRRLSAEPIPDDGDPDGDTTFREYLTIVRAPRIAGFVFVVVAFSFAFNGLVAFLPLFLTTAKGLPTARAGLLYSALFAVSLVQPVTGAVSDRIGRPAVMVTTLGMAGAALALLLADVASGLIFLLVPLVGLGGHGFRPVRDSHLMDLLPESTAGGALGIVRTVMMAIGAVAPAAVGFLSEVTTFAIAFGVLAAAFVAAAVAVVMLTTAA